MLDIARKLFQRVPLSEYTKYASVVKHNQTGSDVVSKQIEQYESFNRELLRQHTQKRQQQYFRNTLNRDFDKNTVLKANASSPNTYYGSSLVLFLLFDWQLFLGTSTYLTMLATAGGAGALFYSSLKNRQTLPSITQIKLINDKELDISIDSQSNQVVSVSDFKFNVQAGDKFKTNTPGFTVQAGDKYYFINEDVRFNRALFEKITQ